MDFIRLFILYLLPSRFLVKFNLNKIKNYEFYIIKPWSYITSKKEDK